MKNQFVADVNDYFKYGLLRALSDCEDLRPTGIWWMLTHDDAGNHGNNVAFLRNPQRFEACDKILFGKLQKIQTDGERNVFAVAKRNLIPKAKFWPSANSRNCDASEMAKASHAKLADPYCRALDFRRMLTRFKNCPLIFADPDNGIETKSASKERHIRWNEMAALFDAGKSLVVYQHKPQGRSLDDDVPILLERIRELLGANALGITCGRGKTKAEIAFLLIPQRAATENFRGGARRFVKQFGEFSKQIPPDEAACE